MYWICSPASTQFGGGRGEGMEVKQIPHVIQLFSVPKLEWITTEQLHAVTSRHGKIPKKNLCFLSFVCLSLKLMWSRFCVSLIFQSHSKIIAVPLSKMFWMKGSNWCCKVAILSACCGVWLKPGHANSINSRNRTKRRVKRQQIKSFCVHNKKLLPKKIQKTKKAV